MYPSHRNDESPEVTIHLATIMASLTTQTYGVAAGVVVDEEEQIGPISHADGGIGDSD
jgi:hypothetical protein